MNIYVAIYDGLIESVEHLVNECLAFDGDR